MTRDYAKPTHRPARARNTRYQPSRKTAPGWIWLLAGIIIGAVGTRVYDYRAGQVPEPAVVDTVADDNGDQPRPRFDFYTLLTANEEVVPEEPEPPKAIASKPEVAKASDADPLPSPADTTTGQAQSQAPPGEVYVLQAGSFRSASDADTLRARLILLNMQASVEKVSPRPGETWHRVLVGPFSDTQRLGNARRELRQNGIDSIQVKRRL